MTLVDYAKMVFFYRTDSKLWGRSHIKNVKENEKGLTISVASTRVPTIFRRTRVFFSMIYTMRSPSSPYRENTGRRGQSRTCSSEANEGGLDVGSNFISG